MTFIYMLYGIYLYALWHLATCFMTFSYKLYDIYLHALLF